MSEFPFKYEEVDEEINEAIKRDFKGHTRGIIKTNPFNLIIPPEFKKYGERIYNMEVRPDDVWIVTFPKSGTTWTQAAMWSIMNDGNIEKLKDQPFLYDWKFLEIDAISKDGQDKFKAENPIPEQFLPMMEKMAHQFESALTAKSPRFIKSHLPFPFLPPKLLDTAKVVYVARNPKDACVSFYYHHKLLNMTGYDEDFPNFFDHFVNDSLTYSPYWPHIIDAWNRRHHPNMLFLFYEELKKDFRAGLRKLANFLEKPLSEEMVEKLLEELSVEGMKRNPALNIDNMGKQLGFMKKEGSFIRKGIVGDWKNHFTPEMEKIMDEWSQKQRQGCDIKFPGEQ